jgi:hypothetical protein
MNKLKSLLVDDNNFLILLCLWISGYYANLALLAVQSRDRFVTAFSFIFSIISFAIGYITYKLDLIKKGI